MSLIEKNDFQILRGGVPGNYEGCHDDALELNDGVTAVRGEFVSLDSGTGKYDKTTLADGAAPLQAFYIVLEGNSGNDDFSGEFTGRVAGLKGRYKVQTKKFDATGMALGAVVSVEGGEFKINGAKPAVGEVVGFDAVAGIIVVDMI